MSSASLAVVSRAHPDPVRIAALSATLALNLAAFVIAMRPQAPAFTPATIPHDALVVQWAEPPAPVPPPPPLTVKPLPPQPAPLPRTRPTPVQPPVVAPTDLDRIATIQPASVAPPATPAHDARPATNTVPTEASLAYRAAPLRYPGMAMRQHMQGTVLLRVLVDENGRPLQVEIAHSSGYVLLDRSARDQVLAGWRFSPAMVDGHAVKAWALVPVSFALRTL
ncbi:energy transducer TonB [Dyella sp. A6]|uniref:energy transducer TonB n=1 Tax=Dyella aluminiiresistens TaxID=3069105 RepID=UPI002E767C37|nr:energy transducer TonB [Dyella sp. A6]